jgi:hypothetical protein
MPAQAHQAWAHGWWFEREYPQKAFRDEARWSLAERSSGSSAAFEIARKPAMITKLRTLS